MKPTHFDKSDPPRRLRYIRTPKTGQKIELTARDISFFQFLHQYAFARSTNIHAFIGGSMIHVIKRLGDLYHGY